MSRRDLPEKAFGFPRTVQDNHPRNLSDLKCVLVPEEGIGVYEWSPGKAAERVPPTQVHLVIPGRGFYIAATDAPAPFQPVDNIILRLKSRDAINSLIETLAKHRDSVWPQ